MAAKKKEDTLFDVHAWIDKNYGKGILKTARDIIHKKRMVVPFAPALQSITGGVPEGSTVSVSGPPKIGKTTNLLNFAVRCQKEEWGGRDVYYLDIEHRLKEMNIEGTIGMDMDKFFPISSEEGNILSAEKYLDIADGLVKRKPGSVIIMDSITSLCGQDEMDGDMSKIERGGSGVKLMSKFIRKNAAAISVNRVMLCGVTQLMSNVTGYGKAFLEKGGNSWKYQSDIRLLALKTSPVIVDGRTTGAEVEWLCDCAAVQGYSPGSKVLSYIRYGEGVDEYREYFELAKELGVITQSGTWFNMGELKFQGAENFRDALKNDTHLFNDLRNKLQEIGLTV
jgi:recombination protein RecA